MATWWRQSSSRATRSPPSSGCPGQAERRDAQMTETTREPAAPSEPGKLDFEVEGMTCGSCAVRIERVLGRQPGVASAEVNFATGKARVASEGPVEVGGLQAAVEQIGYRIRPVEPGRKAE